MAFVSIRLAMRLCFTIRDLLWLTLVVALTAGWRLDHRRLAAPKRDVLVGVVSHIERIVLLDAGSDCAP